MKILKLKQTKSPPWIRWNLSGIVGTRLSSIGITWHRNHELPTFFLQFIFLLFFWIFEDFFHIFWVFFVFKNAKKLKSVGLTVIWSDQQIKRPIMKVNNQQGWSGSRSLCEPRVWIRVDAQILVREKRYRSLRPIKALLKFFFSIFFNFPSLERDAFTSI